MGNEWIFLLLFCHIFRTHTKKEEKRKSNRHAEELMTTYRDIWPQDLPRKVLCTLDTSCHQTQVCRNTVPSPTTGRKHTRHEVKQIFSSMKIHGLQVRMCVGVPQWTLWGRAANEHWEKELLIQAESCSSSWSPYITEKRAHRLVGAVTQLPSYLWERIFVCLHSFRELILFVFSFFFGCQLGLSSDLHLIHKNAAASTAGNDVNKWIRCWVAATLWW